MKTFSISAPWDTKSIVVRVELGKYANGRTRINLIDDSDNEPYCTATTNLPDVLLLDNEVFIKDYSENEGVLDFLTTNNIVIATNKWATSGFVDVQVCTLNPESEWGMIPNLYSDEEPEYDSAGFSVSDRTVNQEFTATLEQDEQRYDDKHNTMPPPPLEIDMVTGKCMWLIKDYKIWANTYEEAVKHLDVIESF
jgi:hypothetical protein